MRALTWQGKRDVRVEDVPDPVLKDPTDVIVKVTSTGLCGSDLHLYEALGPFLDAAGRDRLRACLEQEHRSYGRTMLITGRALADVDRLCERVLVLDAGRLAFEGSLPELNQKVGAQAVLVVDLTEPGRPLDDLPGTDLLAVEAGGLRQRLGLRPGSSNPQQVLAEVTSRVEVRDVTLLELRLDDVVSRLRP